MTLITTAVLVAFFSTAAYYILKWLRIWYYMSKFDGPIALPIIGNAYVFHVNQRDDFVHLNSVLEKYRKRSGGVIRFWLGMAPGMFIYSAKHMEHILGSTVHIKKGFPYKFFWPWLAKGLLTSNGKKWFHRRKMLTPTFHFSILKNFLHVFNEQSSILVKKLDKLAEKPDPVNVFHMITYCVLDVICDTAMGKHINAQGEGENEYVRSTIRMSELVIMRAKMPWFWPDFFYNMIRFGKEQKKCLKVLHGVTNEMIRERMQEPPKRLEESGEVDEHGRRKKVAFLDLLIQMHREDKSFTLDDIREEVDTFMFEGHDTTAAAANWAVLLLGQHLDIQARVHEELDTVLGTSEKPIRSEDLPKLCYLTCVIKEALRLLPSVPMIVRGFDEDLVLDGKVVPKETQVWLHIYALHRDPEWFPEPERFDPDRFLPENISKRHFYAYVPFSAGPRNCIGQKFAMMELKIIIASIFRRFAVESVQKTVDEAQPAGAGVCRPQEGEIMVRLTSRK